MSDPQSVAILGSTGSIGQNALDVIARHPDRFRVHCLSANTSVDSLFSQIRQFNPVLAIMQDAKSAEMLAKHVKQAALDTIIQQGPDALAEAVSADGVDTVIAAIVGASGLLPTLAATKAGKRVLLANKEALVMSGQLMMDAAAASGAVLLPVDSEHNAIFQSLPFSTKADRRGASLAGVEKILLTGSGGPLRKCSIQELAVVSPQQALKHPNWSMGPKISIDSATLMNKGLEVIEACTLFGLDLDIIEVVIHPESVIHSMVQYTDGSVLAQLGQPDMRTPIAHALAWPERIESGVERLDFTALSGLHFEKPDLQRFPCLRLAFEAQRRGDTAATVLNAANEVAVQAFLEGVVSFLQLSETVEYALDEAKISPATDLTTIIDADRDARILAQQRIDSLRAPNLP